MLFFIPVESLSVIRKRAKGKTEERWQRGEQGPTLKPRLAQFQTPIQKALFLPILSVF